MESRLQLPDILPSIVKLVRFQSDILKKSDHRYSQYRWD